MKRIFITTMIAAALLASGLNAQTRTEDKRWIPVAVSSDYQTYVYVDAQTIRRTADVVTVWERFVDRSGTYSLHRTEIHRSGQYRILVAYDYAADGSVIRSWPTPTAWIDPAPGSVQEQVNQYFFPPREAPTVRY